MNCASLVSIIMPTYNRGYIIGRSIESVLYQTYNNFELLIIDDGSVDNTREVVMGFHDRRIKYISYKRNMGACRARNCGLKRAKGEYLAFLDSDNVWGEKYLECRIDRFQKCNKTIGLVWGPVRIFDGKKRARLFPAKTIFEELKRNNKHRLIKEMIFDNQIDTNAVVLRKECVEQAGGFCEELQRLQDWELFFRILTSTNQRPLFDERVLVTNYIGADSIGRDSNADAYWGSRRFFLWKYKELISRYCSIEDLFCYLLNIRRPKCSLQNWMSIVEVMDNEELAKSFCKLINDNRSVCKDLSKERKCYARAIDNLSASIGDLNTLHRKEYGIIEFQNRWIESLIDNKNAVFDSLYRRRVKNVAIYGVGWIGKSLFKLINSSKEFVVTALIDSKQTGRMLSGKRMIDLSEYKHDADIVVITVMDEYEAIKELFDENDRVVHVTDLLEEYRDC